MLMSRYPFYRNGSVFLKIYIGFLSDYGDLNVSFSNLLLLFYFYNFTIILVQEIKKFITFRKRKL